MDDIEMQWREMASQNQSLQTENTKLKTTLNQISSYGQDIKNSVIDQKLNLNELFDKIFNLLYSKIAVRDKEGNEYWEEPEDKRLRVFSDYGVRTIMRIMAFYCRKEHMLANYNELQVNFKVKKFGNELNDLMYCEYENIFYYPSVEELFNLKWDVIQKNKDMYPDLTKEDIYSLCEEISRKELIRRLPHFSFIHAQLCDLVHSIYLRALNGEENKGLNKTTSVIETRNNPEQLPKQGGKLW